MRFFPSNYTNKTQGEIFGVMIFFVLLILGFYFYSQFQAVYSVDEQNSILETESEILVESVMQHIKTAEIQCYSNRGLSGIELLQRCVDNTGIAFSEHNISCTAPSYEVEACQAFKNLINSSLYQLFNGTSSQNSLHSSRAFLFTIIPSDDVRYFHLNKSFNNLDSYNLSLDSSDENYYLREGYSKISTDFQNIPTNQGRFEFELSFFRE